MPGDAPPPDARPVVEWRVAAGGQFDSDSHGMADVGVRRGRLSAQLLTDTLELRWEDAGERGRAWVAARGEAGAVGLVISPWTNGSPDPGRALTGFYAGGEGGMLRYGPGGTYAGGVWSARVYAFAAQAETLLPAPGPRAVATTDAVVGLYRDDLHAWIVGGAALTGDGPGGVVSPRVAAEAAWHPGWTVAPLVEVRAGLAEGTDVVTATRLGGLNPYVVPLAGAAWAEWWVEDYAAARIGPQVQGERGAWTFAAAPVVDLATWTLSESGAPGSAVGFAGLGRVSRGLVYGDVRVGVAPWIPRGEGLSRASAWVEVGRAWGPTAGPRRRRP